MTGYGMGLFSQHAELLRASAITPELARARGYRSVDTKAHLESIHIAKAGQNVPGLLVPMLRKDGSTWGFQFRPDVPRLNGTGKPVKYETPVKQSNGIDVPPGVGPLLNDPRVPLFITEGSRKADAAVCAGLACVSLPGVWSWRGTNPNGGKTAVADWQDIALNSRPVILAFDSDVTRKHEVQKALGQLAGYLEFKGARVVYLHLPHDDGKTGLDDYLTAGHTAADLWQLVRPEPPEAVADVGLTPSEPGAASPQSDSSSTVQPITLDQCHAVFRRWLGDGYDLDVLDVMLCTLAVERLDGDPLWLLVVSGPGAAKTETVQACVGAGALVTSTISSDAALLSGSPRRDRTKDATGGLLRRLGGRGVLVIKDVTSILSMDRNLRATVLAALREIYDGFWERNLGTDGGRSLLWRGRLAVIGAVTTAWDTAHAVVSTLGDRFVLVRLDSRTGRQMAGQRTAANTGGEVAMRAELAGAVGGVLAGLDAGVDLTLAETEIDRLLAAADLVTLSRTGVEYDQRGEVIDAHAPEMPTRYLRQLQQIVRGGLALGMDRLRCVELAIRCARDSMPPIRLAIVDDLARNPHSTPSEIRRRIDLPRQTVDRQCQALHMLRVLTLDEVGYGAEGKTRWHYSLASGIDPTALQSSPEMLVYTPSLSEEGHVPSSANAPGSAPTHISGEVPPQVSDLLADPAPLGCLNCGRPSAGLTYCSTSCAQALRAASPKAQP